MKTENDDRELYHWNSCEPHQDCSLILKDIDGTYMSIDMKLIEFGRQIKPVTHFDFYAKSALIFEFNGKLNYETLVTEKCYFSVGEVVQRGMRIQSIDFIDDRVLIQFWNDYRFDFNRDYDL